MPTTKTPPSKAIPPSKGKGGSKSAGSTKKKGAGRQKPGIRTNFAAEVIPTLVDDEVSDAFVAYSLSVISSRAIPDARDGLKPVQRRILYSMLNMGIRFDTPFKKCARVVGDTMGNYHPHGDAAIYDALVRMGQDFSRGMPLIEPQGNFGSLDDPPAASRYTECRLAAPAMEMLESLAENTVDFRPTYDGESEEPICLPSLIPNLLVNGASGIAVGMTTNISPHNLSEVYEAIKMVLTRKTVTPKELMAKLPGPDFPSGGILIDDGLIDIYKKGRGSFKIRAKTKIDQITNRRQAIIVTELPYLVGPERVLGKIKELMLADRLPEIADIKNLSDRHSGLKIQIDCKQGENPAAVLQKLFKLTPLEEQHVIVNTALVDGVPKELTLIDFCKNYIKHRINVIVRRTNYRLEKAKERLHILEGLVKALDNIDLVISIIRGSKTADEARKGLREKLKLTIVQADSILEMRLRRLTALERQKIIDERDQLKAEIKEYEKLLKSEQKQKDTVLEELKEVVKLFGRPRRTQIVPLDAIEEVALSPVQSKKIPEQACVVTLSTSGNVGWQLEESEERAKPNSNDLIISFAYGKTTDNALGFTDQGRCLVAPVASFGKAEGAKRGTPAQQVFGTNAGENILYVSLENKNEAGSIIVVTEAGFVKHLDSSKLLNFKSGNSYINLKRGDKVACIFTILSEKEDMVMIAGDGQGLRLKLSGFRALGPQAAGIQGMKLKPGTTIIGAGSSIGESSVVLVTGDGMAKVIELESLETKGRGGMGVKLCPLKEKQEIKLAYVGELSSLLAIMTDDKDKKKADPNPVQFSMEPAKKELMPKKTERQILALGMTRWQTL